MKVRLTLTYDGRDFSGFQVQKNAPSIQGELCRALAVFCRQEVPVSGCSRTDAGVHARRFVAHTILPFDTVPPGLVKGVNALLPSAISLLKAEAVGEAFHARYSAKQKTYRYYFYNRDMRSPLLDGRALHVPRKLDLERMKCAAEKFVGTHDFAAFQAAGSKVRDTRRTVHLCRICSSGEDLWYLEISADGFLYRMVRNIMGTLLDIGHGKEYDICALFSEGAREKSGYCAPPHGLYLWEIEY